MKLQLVLAYGVASLGFLSAMLSDILPGAHFHYHWPDEAVAAGVFAVCAIVTACREPA